MSESDRSWERLWVETWRMAGPRLDAIGRQETRDALPEDRMTEIDTLLEIGCQFAQPRTSSGLVEQQRLFAKAKHLFKKAAE